MAFRSIVFPALCILAALRIGRAAAAEAPPSSGDGGDALSVTAEELSPQLQEEAIMDQSRLLDCAICSSFERVKLADSRA